MIETLTKESKPSSKLTALAQPTTKKYGRAYLKKKIIVTNPMALVENSVLF